MASFYSHYLAGGNRKVFWELFKYKKHTTKYYIKQAYHIWRYFSTTKNAF